MKTQEGINLALFEPKSSWVHGKIPEHLTSQSVKRLAIDVESRDPDLIERGPGFLRGRAEVVGISLSDGVGKWYLPIGHLSGGNMDRDNVIRFMRDLTKVSREWIGANIQYDLEALNSLEITLDGTFRDIQITDALIDEEQTSYSLEALSKKYLCIGKDETLLREASSAFGIDPKSDMWKMHSKYVGPYAEMDAYLTMHVHNSQQKHITGLEEIMNLECSLIPIIWKMRKQGIRVNLCKAQMLSEELKEMEQNLHVKMWRDHDQRIDVWSSRQIAQACDSMHIFYPRTTNGAPSFKGDWLDKQDKPFLSLIAEIRTINRLRTVFVDQWIFNNHVKGVIHPEWKQLMSDDGGTRTGRMAAANPNPQQIPGRSDLAPKVRKLFIPHNGKWGKYDYSQQEPRLAVHYADKLGLTGASLTRLAYHDNPNMDIYQFLATAAGISRRQSKDLTLGRFYGMGKNKLANKLGVSVDEAENLLRKFDEGIPFIRELSDICSNMAKKRGWIKTVCGRRRNFNLWEPANSYDRKKNGENIKPRKLDDATVHWEGKLVRSLTHKALNSLIQGSAADMTKMSMLRIYEQLKIVPIMQVHDELNYSIDDEAQAKQILELMSNSVELTVPMKVDIHIGNHWK
jgi:DNA polymerase I-like protein with 3'-5' exonuclease and polymerase domains